MTQLHAPAPSSNGGHGDDKMDKLRMIHLKTKEECRLGNETIQVWTVEMPSKWAETVLQYGCVLKDQVEDLDAIDLQHCRRFAKPKFLPPHVLGPRNYATEMHSISRAWDSTPQEVMQMPATTIWEWSTEPKSSKLLSRPQTLHLLICPTRIVAKDDLDAILLQTPPFSSDSNSWAFPLRVKEVTVPLLAPTSPEQANEWSDQYWPTFYRKTNPFGAHPATIQRAEDDLQEPVGDNINIRDMMLLAETIAEDMKLLGWGVGTGCVVVERTEDATEIIAVAGDARLKPLPVAEQQKPQSKSKKKNKNHKPETDGCCGSGNIMAHPVMRAIGMVGRKRLRCASQPITAKSEKSTATLHSAGLAHDEVARDAFFLDLPLNDLEREHFEKDNIKADGYLCLKLEIFLTHEPCVMCSMALVHSRVGRVIFKNRMPETGGLTAEMNSNHTGPIGLGYGLCWRKELNWQFMCWEYLDPAERGLPTKEEEEALAKEKAQYSLPSRPFLDRTNTDPYRKHAYPIRNGVPNGKVGGGHGSFNRGGYGRGGEDETSHTPNQSTASATAPPLSSNNAFAFLGDDGADLPSDDDEPNDPITNMMMNNASGDANSKSSFLAGVHV